MPSIKSIKILPLIFLFYLIFLNSAYAQNCYAKGDGFGVYQPYLTDKVCFLYEHSKLLPPESEMKQTLPGEESLHPDPLMAEYLYLIVNRRYLAIKKGTPFYNCGYDLETLKRDPGFAKLIGAPMPEFHCSGFVFQFVPVRLINENTCLWVALDLVDCGNIEEDYDIELRWKREPNVRW
ncbi:MAG TPA: hypothetical protein PK564_00995 [bacterium]|nr:hypothetical protein [bacterium]